MLTNWLLQQLTDYATKKKKKKTRILKHWLETKTRKKKLGNDSTICQNSGKKMHFQIYDCRLTTPIMSSATEKNETTGKIQKK